MRDHPLRTAAEALSPKIRRDRGDGLYIAHGHLSEHAFFRREIRSDFTFLSPSAEGMRALALWLDAHEIPGFDRFTDRSLSAEDISLLCRGIKLLETACPPEEALLFERAVRQRAALLLRTRNEAEGGSIPVCMRIAHQLQKTERGMKT